MNKKPKPRTVRLYFVSDSGAAFCDAIPGTEGTVAAKALATLPGYRWCSRQEYLAKRRWQRSVDVKVPE